MLSLSEIELAHQIMKNNEANGKLDNTRVIDLFSGTLWEAELIHSLLADAGIQSFVRNDVATSYLYDPIQASGVKVMILETDLHEASGIVNAFTGPANKID